MYFGKGLAPVTVGEGRVHVLCEDLGGLGRSQPGTWTLGGL